MEKSIATATQELIAILEPMDSGDRARLVTGVCHILGIAPPLGDSVESREPASPGNQAIPATHSHPAHMSADFAEFFATKDPQNKQEQLVVAARYIESTTGRVDLEKNDITQVFSDAGLNFDVSQFKRDLANAKSAGLVMKGNSIKLSYHGKLFVDALPNREEADKHKSKAKPRKKTGAKRTKAASRAKGATSGSE